MTLDICYGGCGGIWFDADELGRVEGRAAASLAVFRDLIVSLTEVARQDPVSIAIGKMLDRSGYLQDLREDRSEDSEARIENLAELVSAAREYETREPEPARTGFVHRLSLLSDAQIRDGFRAAGFVGVDLETLSRVMRRRIAELGAL